MRSTVMAFALLGIAGCGHPPASSRVAPLGEHCTPDRAPAEWGLAQSRRAAVTFCLPPRYRVVRTTPDEPEAWAARGSRQFAARVIVQPELWPAPPTLAHAPRPDCADCYTSQGWRRWTDTLAGRPVTFELALVSGGYAHQHRVPTARWYWEAAPGRWRDVTVSDPTDPGFTVLWVILHSVRFAPSGGGR